MNYFDFFGLEPKFQLDTKKLKLLYYEKMREFHPDMQINASLDKQEETLQLSSVNNDAFKTLKDFHSRLKYILTNFYPGEEPPSKSLPQMFLMEMMDMNEELMELKMDYNEESASKMQVEIESKLVEMEAKVRGLVEDKLVVDLDKAGFDQVNTYLLERNYLLRAIENIKEE